MRIILHSRSLYIFGALVLIAVALFMLVRVVMTPKETRITALVTQGEVVEVVPVSGVVELENTAHLSFKVSDTITEVRVSEGESVTRGDILALQNQAELRAEAQQAEAALLIAVANRDELLAGPREEARQVTSASVLAAENTLRRTIAEEDEKVRNAQRIFLSTDLEALPVDKNNADLAPTVSGTYTCEDEGDYNLSIYPSAARSGFSYEYTGLESGVTTAHSESPAPLGTCGLYIQFVEGEHYGNADWYVTIPNPRGASYTTNLSNLELARKARDNKIKSAEEALDQVLKEQTLENASPREEALRRTNAEVLRAEANLAAIHAQLAARTLTAPFSGVITSVDMAAGETSAPTNSITLVGEQTFTLTVRIPEIDVARINVGNDAEVVFDAQQDERIEGTVSFISPIATEIDGVGYFEAKIGFLETPTWLRGGLNADVDIIVDRRERELRVPKRFLIERDGNYFVLVAERENAIETPVTLVFMGNDGFAAVAGLRENETIIAP